MASDGAAPARLTVSAGAPRLSAAELRAICLEAGADDVGFVEIERPAFDPERADMLKVLPRTRTLISIVVRMNAENCTGPNRSVANGEFHETGYEVNHVARQIVIALRKRGIKAANPAMAFPMEISRIPESQPWLISLKIVAEQAGLGRMGIHRNVIHPKFGNFILLGAVLCEAIMDEYGRPLDYNPCVTCKLCVAACPVGAISPDGHFNVTACATHNYREFLGGFSDWVETIADSAGKLGYRKRMEDPETLSMWQSLAFGPNYKAAYCLSVCPAGEDVMGPFIASKAEHIERVVRPLQEKAEPLYVVKGSDAEAFAQKRYPHKRLRYVHNGMRPASVRSFLQGIVWQFQRGRAEGLSAVYHFTFTGRGACEATVAISGGKISVRDGLHGRPDVRVRADGPTWVRFLRKETSLFWSLATRRIRIGGGLRAIKLMGRFGACFPS